MKWKKSYGDLDQQEHMIKQKLSNDDEHIVVHNIKTAKQLIDKMNSEIGLNQDEVIMILFTSID